MAHSQTTFKDSGAIQQTEKQSLDAFGLSAVGRTLVHHPLYVRSLSAGRETVVSGTYLSRGLYCVRMETENHGT
jgi:hypothetical protein